ncbi:MAG: serine/threonine protein kinase, partial [Candidatus Promineifilaceae bacterium]
MNSLIGRILNQYQLKTLLGSGGMGSVYRAKDLNSGQWVAVKVMHTHLGHKAQFRTRFLDEARTLSRLHHSGIVQVLDYGEVDGQLFMALELLEGGNLTGHVNQLRHGGSNMAWAEVVRLAIQLADALDFAHTRQVIHRDIKPDNILLERNNRHIQRAVLSDFGIAALVGNGDDEDTEADTNEGNVAGSVSYMAPECFMGETLDRRSDLYALGTVLYQLLNGSLPFNGTSPA